MKEAIHTPYFPRNHTYVPAPLPIAQTLSLSIERGLSAYSNVLVTMLYTLAFILSLLTPISLHAQDANNADPTTANAEESTPQTNLYSNSYDSSLSDSQAPESIVRYEVFSPKFPELDDTLRDADKIYFEKILKTLAQIKTELNSTYVTLSDRKQRLDRLATLQGRSYYRADTLLTTNYYESTVPVIRTNYYLVKGLAFLKQLEDLITRRQAAFRADIDKAMLDKVIYELKTLLGVSYTLRGGTNDLFLAARQFEYILGDNKDQIVYVSSAPEQQTAYYYLAGIYDRLYKKINYTDEVRGRPLIRKKLFYLWSLIEINNNDNQDLKAVKLQDLADRYVSVIDYEGVNYKKLYAPYVDNIIKRFKKVDELVEEAPVSTISGAVPAAATSEPAATEEGQ